MVWVGRDLKDHLVPTPLPWAGTSSARVVNLYHQMTSTSTKHDARSTSQIPIWGSDPISCISLTSDIDGIQCFCDNLDTSEISWAQKFFACVPSKNKPSKVWVPLGCAQFLLVTYSGLLRELIGFVEHEETEIAICTSIRLYF